MSQDDRKRSRETKGSVSPELKDIDLSWDDEVGALDLDFSDDDDAFDRVTAIPEIPNEVLARRLMERAEAEAKATSERERSKPRGAAAVPPLSLDLEQELYEPDHDEPTLRIDREDLKQSAQRMVQESSPNLSFEFQASAPKPASEQAPTRGVEAGEERLAKLPSDFPAALGMLAPEATPAAEAPKPPLASARTETQGPAPPLQGRARLPTVELMLDLDGPQAPSSALELAENAPMVERSRDSDLEFDVPRLSGGRSLASADPEQSEMRDRYAMGDFTGALVVAEGILEDNPNEPEAMVCAERCRDVLTQMYSARLGPMSQTVAVAIPNDEIRWLSLDHRAGFLLSLVDGSLTLEEILDISGMSKLDALRLMFTLFDQRVITLR